jgi:hypothetical protein
MNNIIFFITVPISGATLFYLTIELIDKLIKKKQKRSRVFFRCPICAFSFGEPGKCPSCKSKLESFNLVYKDQTLHTLNYLLGLIEERLITGIENDAIKRGKEVIDSQDVENAILKLFHSDPGRFLNLKQG